MYNKEFEQSKHGAYILNIDNQGRGGTHWVACILSPGKVEYFDSYGMPPNFTAKNLYYNDTYIQDPANPNDAACGYYCVHFLYYVYKSKLPYKKYLEMFKGKNGLSIIKKFFSTDI